MSATAPAVLLGLSFPMSLTRPQVSHPLCLTNSLTVQVKKNEALRGKQRAQVALGVANLI